MNCSQSVEDTGESTGRKVHQQKFMFWNVQGAGSREFLNLLREHIHMHRPSILALVETRISRRKAQAVCDRIGYDGCFRVEAQGFQGGIWVLWNSNEIGVDVVKSHEQFVTVEVKPQNRRSWLLSVVYASPHIQLREILWQELQRFASEHQKPWLLAGDFNETTCLEERNHGGPEMIRRCTCFKHWIENNRLIDLGFSGPKYTWSRGLTGDTIKEARLDRALCNAEWRLRFQEGSVRHLIRACSDHSPLLLSTDGFAQPSSSRKPFRFHAAWVYHHQFEEFVKDNWTPHYPLVQNLSNLAAELSTWNKEVFGNLFRAKRRFWARIEGIQQRLDAEAPRYFLELDRRLRQELNQTLDQIALLWFQKARIDQIRDGDRNTKYFHMSTVIQRRFNRIDVLKDSEERWCTNSNEVKRLVVDHFKTLFSEEATGPSTFKLNTSDFPTLPTTLVQDLEKSFTTLEIQHALKEMHPLKAPGPDGFHAYFFQKYWHIVEEKVCKVVLQVLRGNHMPQGLNDTFLTLIPKVPNPERVSQFRPIGLCNVTYKLVTKFIVNKLKRVLLWLISPLQSSFIPRRQITDNVIVMQEVLHSMRRKTGTKGWMAIKLDLEKAYDRLRWEFIQETLTRMKLPKGLVAVIMNCISSYSLNILWNGEPTETFQPSRGIRQGDPLSPYLFVACMERLSQLIETYSMEGKWRAIPITGGAHASHILCLQMMWCYLEKLAKNKHGWSKAVYKTFVRRLDRK